MTTDDILANLGAQRTAGAKGRHQHAYDRPPSPAALEDGDWRKTCRCGRRENTETRRKARSSVRLGKDTERRIERLYGPLKVGERGDAIDLLGHDWKWQSKATRGVMPQRYAAITSWAAIDPARWITVPMDAMEPLHRELRSLLIRSWVRVGIPTRDLIVVRSSDWAELHGGPAPASDLMAMTGEWFLEMHGRDERR